MKQFDLKTPALTSNGESLVAYIIRDNTAKSKWRLRIYNESVDLPLKVLKEVDFEQFPIFEKNIHCINCRELVEEAETLVKIE